MQVDKSHLACIMGHPTSIKQYGICHLLEQTELPSLETPGIDVNLAAALPATAVQTKLYAIVRFHIFPRSSLPRLNFKDHGMHSFPTELRVRLHTVAISMSPML